MGKQQHAKQQRNHQISEEDRSAAASWWNSLPGGKKRYLKEHSRLSSEEKIQRYWLAHVKAATPLAVQEPASLAYRVEHTYTSFRENHGTH